MADQFNSDDERKPGLSQRPWYVPHPLSCLVLLIVGTGLADCQLHSPTRTIRRTYYFSEIREEFGWPRTMRVTSTHPFRPAWIGESIDRNAIIVNVAASMAFVSVVVLTIESWSRRRFQFSVRGLLFATAGAALALTLWPLFPWREPWYIQSPLLIAFAIVLTSGGHWLIRTLHRLLHAIANCILPERWRQRSGARQAQTE